MKKRYIVGIIVAVVIVLIVASVIAYYFIKKAGREYEIETVKDYQYFILKNNNQSGVINRNGDI